MSTQSLIPTLPCLAVFAAVAAFSPAIAIAQTAAAAVALDSLPPRPALTLVATESAPLLPAAPTYSSSAPSSAADESAAPVSLRAEPAGRSASTQVLARVLPTRPFSAFAVAAKVGSGGIGFDIATPLGQSINLRGGASFFSYNANLTEDGLQIDGSLKFQNASVMVDFFPFHNAFRISPGITVYNSTGLNAKLLVPAGQTFSLGDTDYTSDPTNPIHGTADFNFGNKIAPRITAGFGNMIPRGGGHWSVPFEIGFQYIAQPTVRLNITGNGCSYESDGAGNSGYGCGPVEQSDVAQEQSDLQSDLNGLRFFPIVSVGVSYRFGHTR